MQITQVDQKVVKLNLLSEMIDKRLDEMEAGGLLKCPNETELMKWFQALPTQEALRVVSIGALYVNGFVVPEEFYDNN